MEKKNAFLAGVLLGADMGQHLPDPTTDRSCTAEACGGMESKRASYLGSAFGKDRNVNST